MDTGAEIVARSLKRLGTKVVFGIVGIPVIEVAEACIAAGIRFIGFRNEQSASYAASAYGYLTGKPGVCLVVGGPGVVHAMAAGSSETAHKDKGAFQELDQVSLLKPHTKFATQPVSLDSIPAALEKGLRTSYFGRPGACYVDLPANIIQGRGKAPQSTLLSVPPRIRPDSAQIDRAVQALRNAKAPLIVIGKGSLYDRAEEEIKALVDGCNIPFLPSPMAKGTIPDDHELNAGSARSTALKSADVVLLLGARLNWIFHFGSTKWSAPIFIQVDVSAEELGNNATKASFGIQANIRETVTDLTKSLKGWNYRGPFVQQLQEAKAKNAQKLNFAVKSPLPLNTAIHLVEQYVYGKTKDVVWVSEGANTMDQARSIIPIYEPRTRLDAGTMATMGVGSGYAIAAQLLNPKKKVVSVVGDSAFGFSAMEVETMVRNSLPIVTIVMNNGGVYKGVGEEYEAKKRSNRLPSTALDPTTRYEKIAQGCGANGMSASDERELKSAVETALASSKPSVINVVVESGSEKKLVW